MSTAPDWFRRPAPLTRPEAFAGPAERYVARAPESPATASVSSPPKDTDNAPAPQGDPVAATPEPETARRADYARRAAKAKGGPIVPGRCDGCGEALPKRPHGGGSPVRWCTNRCRCSARRRGVR